MGHIDNGPVTNLKNGVQISYNRLKNCVVLQPFCVFQPIYFMFFKIYGGVSVHMISRLLGHTSVLVTEKVYATFLLPILSRQVRGRLCFMEFRAEE